MHVRVSVGVGVMVIMGGMVIMGVMVTPGGRVTTGVMVGVGVAHIGCPFPPGGTVQTSGLQVLVLEVQVPASVKLVQE